MAQPRSVSAAGSASRTNWVSSLNWQIDFYSHARRQQRVDSEFDYRWFEGRQNRIRAAVTRAARSVLQPLRRERADPECQQWVNANAAQLWETRGLLEDELSRLLFDSTLILTCTSYRQFYFPRLDFTDLVSIVADEPFVSKELPDNYLGLPLRTLTLELCRDTSRVVMVTTKEEIRSIDSYRQYLIERNSVDFTPADGDVVLDCGACIGDVSGLFARLVGPTGEVHLFDPVPLHARYCHLQASLNPSLAHVFHVNVMAVGGTSGQRAGSRTDSTQISPGGLSIDAFSTISLDEYVSSKALPRVTMIKMDIEGAEVESLQGASETIRQHKPRLAIAAYHKPEHLWEIPHALKAHNYRLFFGHHSPVAWESVYYAAS
jgi:FkbM family methyltransferase